MPAKEFASGFDTELTVSSHLAFCFAGDRPVFLDTVRARYFTLPEALGKAFGHVILHGRDAKWGAETEILLRKGVLQRGARAVSRHPIVPALRDTDLSRRGSFSLPEALRVASAVRAARRDLVAQPFAETIRRLRANPFDARRADTERTLDLSIRFHRHRAFVAIPSVCLLDSLALRSFLAARGGQADLVFGVIASPWAAHCWLQLGDQVLNDSLERVGSFTPILVL